MFRGKEPSNRIELSRLVQGLLNFWCFGLLVALGRGQVGGGMGGVPHTCTCTHMHAHAHTHILYMYRNCKWPPTWRHPCLSCLVCLTCMCVHACMHVCACMHAWNTPHTPIPTPIHPSAIPQGGGPPESLKIR